MAYYKYTCPKCKYAHHESGFCEECHKKLVKICANCSEESCICN